MSENVTMALEEAEKLVAALKGFDGTPAAHLGLLKQTDTVRRTLEEPVDVVNRLVENMSCTGALHTLLGTGALQMLPADGGPLRAADVAAATNIDVSAVTRSFRLAVVNGIVVETAPDVYAHNALSRAFLPEGIGAFFLNCMDFIRTWVRLPEYFASHAPEDLFDLRKSPFSFIEGKEGMTYYEVLNADPAKRVIWNSTMQQVEKNMPILGMFPFATLKDRVEAEPDRPFIVDIGSGKGQAMVRIETECPRYFGGKVILQDLPVVIDTLNAEELPNIETMAYDIFSGPNPVKSTLKNHYPRRTGSDAAAFTNT